MTNINKPTHLDETSILEFKDFYFYYQKNKQQIEILKNINLTFFEKKMTAIIGPSGCGKSTLLWSINRLNELKFNNSIKGKLFFENKNIYSKKTDLLDLRKKIGLVFQKPTPFATSIYKNITFALRFHGINNKAELDKIVKSTLKQVNLWNEVKNRLHTSALDLSGGQQQRLCIARCLATKPKILLMDEPTSSLDPISREKIENLLFALKKDYTILLVTHSLSQASKISDYLVYLNSGKIIEYGKTRHVFTQPKHKETADYIMGRIDQ